jgi:hypothetical protein
LPIFISECGFGGALNRLPSTRLNSGSCVGLDLSAMIDVFHSARLTFERAQHHINEFNSMVFEFVQSKPYASFVDQQTDPTKDIHKIKFTRQLPQLAACVLFDIANNLRAVLDQAGYASAIANGMSDPKSTNFPFADDLPGLNANIERRGVCKHLHPEIVALFRSFQPYKGGNDTLWALNKLCNAKKHCALIPLRISNASANFRAVIPEGGQVGAWVDSSGTFRGWDPEKHEMTLAAVPRGTDPQIRSSFSFLVMIDGIEALRSQPALGLVDQMRSVVQGVLMATEAECRRLRLIP